MNAEPIEPIVPIGDWLLPYRDAALTEGRGEGGS